ncbi:MAG: hypothetical protein GY765_36530, partial [bacterium]|nr:hypothetical protein [bacterium]
MVSDLDIIKQLEKQLGIELEKRPIDNLPNNNAYAVAADNPESVTGLNVLEGKLNDLSLVMELQCLTSLAVVNMALTDVSPLAGLQALETLILMNNKITTLPPDVARLHMAVKWEFKAPFKGMFLYGNPLERPPVVIVRKGKNAINAWFDSFAEAETQTLNEGK